MWAPINNYSHYSLHQGLSKATQLADRCAKLGYTSAGITDRGSISGVPSFMKAMKKKKIKSIIGTEMYFCDNPENKDIKDTTTAILIAKNLDGWKNLIQNTSASNQPKYFLDTPRISLPEIKRDGLLCITGHPGSEISKSLFVKDIAYVSSSYEDAKKMTNTNWKKDINNIITKYIELFGKENLFFSINLIPAKKFPAYEILAKTLRYFAKIHNIKCIASQQSYYPSKYDAADHRVMLADGLECPMSEISTKTDNPHTVNFTSSNCFYIPEPEEISSLYELEEINNVELVNSMCEEIKIFVDNPIFPTFECPNGMSADEYLREKCVRGWNKYKTKVPQDKLNIYLDRIKTELDVFKSASLAPYFLIVEDYCSYAKNNGWLMSPGRGCLTPCNNILTYDGIKPINNIKKGDNVFTIDGTLKIVNEVYEYDCEEELINIKSFYGNTNGITLTKDHKVLVYNTKNILWKEAKDVTNHDYLVQPIIKNENIKDITFDLAEFANFDDTRFDDNYVYHEPKNVLCNTIQFSRKINRYIKLDKDLLYIIGIFTGDGWLVTNKNNPVGFVFNDKDIKTLEFVKNFFENIGCNVSIIKRYKKKKCLQLIVNDRFIRSLFSKLFNRYKMTSMTKHVPDLINTLDKELIKYYINGYKLADGNCGKNKIKYSTTSIELAKGIRKCLLYCGIPSSLIISNRIGQKNITNIEYIINTPKDNYKRNYNFAINEDYILTKVRKVSKLNYSGKVYDLNVEKNHNYLTDSGLVHNSAAGSLVAMLIGITDNSVDPIKHNLLFERFYNAGRNAPGRISLPDIDCDFPVGKRGQIKEYIKKKYGDDKVSEMVTFARAQGRGAMKAVMRGYGNFSFEDMNKICDPIPDESEIMDELQEMREETGEASIIKWALENIPDKLKEWCVLNKEGQCEGDLSSVFEQAIRIEGTKVSQGKHAAGIIISPTPLALSCPMVYDKSNDSLIAGMEMGDLEAMGQVKFDILGVAVLDKIMTAIDIIEEGD